jgi:DnaJ-class molecular chaperone
VLLLLVYSVICTKDYYKVLNLPRNASKKDIKKKYRELSMEFHPDKNRSDSAKEKYIQIGKGRLRAN